MTALPAFSDILTSLSRVWSTRNRDNCVVSFALPIRGVDPLYCLPVFSKANSFKFSWDSPTDCFVASGKSQHIELTGPRRFELAQRFNDSVFSRLLDLTPDVPLNAKPRILFASSFFEQISEREQDATSPPGLQGILPRWQLTNHGEVSILRINGIALQESDARELVEELWLMREKLINLNRQQILSSLTNLVGISCNHDWQSCYQKVLSRGIDLVNSGGLKKLVLAVRHSILLNEPLDPLSILIRLREQQQDSCRFLWQNNANEAFFGASPERLLTIKGSYLMSDALAGTSSANNPEHDLISSDKDRREHQVVVASIVNQLIDQGLRPKFSAKPRLVRYGNLLHLHTEIIANDIPHKPFQLINALHPTPAVAGFPLKDALNWIRVLEPFERGRYAAPLGWINSLGDAEFRVAIRCGNATNKKLDLIAGAGLVRGSIEEKEVREVTLKLAVLADQFDLTSKI